MKRRAILVFTILAVVAAMLFAFGTGPAGLTLAGGRGGNNGGNSGGSTDNGDLYSTGEVTAKLKSGVRSRTITRRHDLSEIEDLSGDQYLYGFSDSRTVDQVVAQLIADSDVIWAKPNFLLRLPEMSGTSQRSGAYIDQRSVAFINGTSPANYFDQYAISLIRAKEAASGSNHGAGVTVAVIDTGVDTTHPVFNFTVPGADFVDNDNNPTDSGSGPATGHGTMVAGIVALVARNVAIMPLRAFDPNGVGKVSNVSKAIKYATDNGAQIINMSFGMTATDYQGSVLNAVAYAASMGVVMIAAAGNDNSTTPQYPASDQNVLSVGATDQYDNKASFSNSGSWVGVGAPGVGIYSSYPNGMWAWWDGTSFAAPFASGEAALRLGLGAGNAVTAIKNTTVTCCGGSMGSGRIDCLAGVNY